MKLQKRTFGSLLLITLLLLLAACGGTKDGGTDKESTGGTDKSPDQKITIFQSKVEISDQLEALAKEYTAETGVEVDRKSVV